MPSYLTITAILFALLSAIFWFLSSRVNFAFGFDMDKELNEAMSKASKLNAWAALFTALAIICQAVSMILGL